MLLTFQTCSQLPWRPTRLDGFHESTLQITKIAEQRLVLASGFSWLGVLGIRSFWFKGIVFFFWFSAAWLCRTRFQFLVLG